MNNQLEKLIETKQKLEETIFKLSTLLKQSKKKYNYIKELIIAREKGFDVYLAFVIQREDCKHFKIAEDIDSTYKNAFDMALKNGVKILCYDCKLNNKEIKINNKINYEY